MAYWLSDYSSVCVREAYFLAWYESFTISQCHTNPIILNLQDFIPKYYV